MKDDLFKPRHIRLAWALAGALLGAIFFLWLYGIRVLDPTNVEWLLKENGDPGQHYLGWEFYRSSAWDFPYLGMSYDVIYPHRTSVVYSDSIPLFALFFKLLDPLLGPRFQYLGIWGLLCFVLQGYFSQRIVARVGGADLREASRFAMPSTLLGVCLFLLFPALTIRMFGHTALAGNWLILIALWIFFDAEKKMQTLPKACLVWGGVGILAAGFHLYYLAMIGMVLVGVAVQQLLRRRGGALALLPIVSYCATALVELFVWGAFASNFADSEGLPYMYAADLAGLFIPQFSDTFETNIFVGPGVLLLIGVVLASFLYWKVKHKGVSFWKQYSTWIIPSIVIFVLSLLASVSPTVTLAGKTLFTVPLPEWFIRFWGMFASCARLAWVAEYLLLALLCACVFRFCTLKLAMLILALCAAVQAGWQADRLIGIHNRYRDENTYHYATSLQDSSWNDLAQCGKIEHISFASFNVDTSAFWDFALLAADNDWTVNSFYLAHMNRRTASLTLLSELDALKPQTLYVFLGIDEIRTVNIPLHYYRVDGYLVGSLEELPLQDVEPTASVSIGLDKILNQDHKQPQRGENGEIMLAAGESVSGPVETIFPGRYTVTVEGSGLDHTYIYSGWHYEKDPYQQLEITFLEGTAQKMVFEFYAYSIMEGWDVSIHTLDDTPVTIESISIEANGV